MKLEKYLLPYQSDRVYNDQYEYRRWHFLKEDYATTIYFNGICWRFIVFGMFGMIDQSINYYKTHIEAMSEADKILIELGYILIPEDKVEQY